MATSCVTTSTSQHDNILLSFKRTDNLAYRRATVIVEPIVDAVAHLDGYGGVEEVGGAYLDGCCASHEELDGVLGGADAAKTYYRNLHSLSHLPYHAYGNRLDSRTAQSAGVDAEHWATALNVDSHAHECVDERYAVSTFHYGTAFRLTQYRKAELFMRI